MRMRLLLLALLSAVSCVHAHLSLTFPPARRFAMDFLDNVRTSAPCGGMTYDGRTKTTLKAGEPITFTWKGVYPHSGGIQIQLLNATSNAIIANLSGDSYLYTNDSTIREHSMTIGSDHVCDHCILRLIRQAGEWTANLPGGYLFWSCADVSIVNSSEQCYSGKCLNNGTCNPTTGNCTCQNKYAGNRCQYKNDCEGNADCNNNGNCSDIMSTYYPTKVCFCKPGKMGQNCEKDSPVSEAVKTAAELQGYYQSELYANPSYKLYWKIIGTAKDEIEFVLQVNTTNWIGIGWRPSSVTGQCRNFPINTASNNGGTPEPEPEPEGTAAPPKSTAEHAARKRREAEFEIGSRILERVKRQAAPAERNILMELCQAGNTTEAINWATRNFNSAASGAVPEPSPEGEPAPEGATPAPEGEPAPTPEGEGAPAPEGETTPAPEGSPETSAPANFHPMDCQDMVIIAAEGNHHRILDSYTRDRSTPMPDTYFGGTDDLTAAAARRVDGMLHAVFRRKLVSNDRADHTLTDSTATVVWARGQNPVRMYHWPLTGMERCQASNYDFYRVNELKYHGTKDSQRGRRDLNFFQDPTSTETAQSGEHRSPSACTGDSCNYIATWSYRKSLKVVQFTITARVQSGQWAAIGFSNDQNMPNSDAVIVWMNDANTAQISDRYITARSQAGVTVDANQDAQVTGGSYNNGMMTVMFNRALTTSDSDKDLGLDECRYFIYAWGGGFSAGNILRHSNTGASTNKICLNTSGSGSASRFVISNFMSWSWVICAILISRLTLN